MVGKMQMNIETALKEGKGEIGYKEKTKRKTKKIVYTEATRAET